MELKSSDYADSPAIKTGYFSHEADLKTLRDGIKLSRKLAKTKAFADYIGEEIYPGEHVQSDEQLDDYIRSVSAHFHTFVFI